MIRTGAGLAILTVGLTAFAPSPQQTPPAKPPTPAGRDIVAGPPAAPAGTGVISGTVVAVDTGRPVRKTRVTLAGGDVRLSKSVMTDDCGVFSFTELPAGEFTLRASRGGFLDASYGQPKPGSTLAGTPIRLAAAQHLERLALRIPRGGVITGTITDEAGDASFGTSVTAYRYGWRTGERTLQPAGGGTTDDRGIYRITALPPGEYIVSATPREADAMAMAAKIRVEQLMAAAQASGSPTVMDQAKAELAGVAGMGDVPEVTSGYAPVYFPGTIQAASATTFTLGISEEHTGVDVQLQVVPLATVSGAVMSSQGTSGPGQVQLVDRTQPSGLGSRFTRVGPDGTFTFTGVPPGQYTILARASSSQPAPSFEVMKKAVPGAGLDAEMMQVMAAKMAADSQRSEQLWGMSELAVNGRKLTNITVSLQPGMAVSGSVAFEGGTPPPPAQLARMTVMLSPVTMANLESAQPSPAQIDGEGRFTIRGVMPGLYRVIAASGVPQGYTIKSAVFTGRDALDFPMEVKAGEDQGGGVVTFSTRSGDVSGTLQDNTGAAPAPGYTIILFPSDAKYWLPQARRIQSARAATDGRFGFSRLPAGEYRLAAVADIEPGQWYDAALLRQLAGASVGVTVSEGGRSTQDLRIR